MAMDADSYMRCIKDAEWRIGSYIAGGGSSEDKYVKDQMKRIEEWHRRIMCL